MVDEDTHAARWALRSGRPVLLVVNKVDDAQHEASSWEFLGLGAGDPHTVSAQHGRGTGDLLDEIVAQLGENRVVEEVADADDDGALRVAIVGRPNVGKSTLFNQLIGEERSVVHDLPGTTRDAIDTLVVDRRGAHPLHRHGRDASARQDRRRASRPTPCCAVWTPSTAPTSRSW